MSIEKTIIDRMKKLPAEKREQILKYLVGRPRSSAQHIGIACWPFYGDKTPENIMLKFI